MPPVPIKPVLLIILDGFGCRHADDWNAITRARKPNFDHFWHDYPHTLIQASEAAVGLPAGQMGNSEVGHLNIGAGRVVYQDFSRIDHTIRNGNFKLNLAFNEVIDKARAVGGALHIFGLLSDGGVHSHQDHFHALIDLMASKGVEKVYFHAFLDGRDTPPRSAGIYLRRLLDKMQEARCGQIASVVGRYYAMDRDRRWNRVKPAYDLLTLGRAEFTAPDAMTALEMAYARDENDEFVKPTAIVPQGGEPTRMQDGDAIIFMNFRSDRARQMTRAFTFADFNCFEREYVPKLSSYCTLTSYSEEFNVTVAYPPERVRNGFGEYVANLGLRQLRIAETEKYPHVTYFFNGGEETVYAGEDRIMVKSPDVATYDLQPEMSAAEVTDKLVEAIESKKYHAIICNYANCDMVGHTGFLDAATKAVETIDVCLGRVVTAMQGIGGEVLITADHGNAETMRDPVTHQPHTAHTTNLVPLIYIGRPGRLQASGALEDLAPTLLKLMGLPQPREMTGTPLVELE